MPSSYRIVVLLLLLLAASAAIVGYGGVIRDVAAVGRITLACSIVLAAIVAIAGLVGKRKGTP